jgi:hypothetical protein
MDATNYPQLHQGEAEPEFVLTLWPDTNESR